MEPFDSIGRLSKEVFSKETVQNALFATMVIISAITYAIAKFLISPTEHSNIRDFLLWLSDGILVTGLISLFINVFTYMGVFRRALSEVFDARKDAIRAGAADAIQAHHETVVALFHDVLYEGKHLSQRRDLQDIWRRTTEALYNHRFPAITPRLVNTIHKSFLPVNKDFYYGSYRR